MSKRNKVIQIATRPNKASGRRGSFASGHFRILIGACLAAAYAASAATETWNGGAVPDGNWTTAGNWNGATPATNDLLIFTGGTQTATTNNYPAGTPFNNILFNSGASAFTLNGNPFTLSSPTDAGSGQIAGGSIASASANNETIRTPIVLANGNHTISSSGGGILRLNGAITHSNGAVVMMSGNINATGGFSTNGNLYGILGGWAIFNNNWATLDASSNVIAYSGYTDVAGGGTIANNLSANVRIPVNGAAISITAPATAINSLLFGSSTASSANQTVTIGAGNKLVLGQNGGIFNSTSIAGAGTYRQLTIGANDSTRGILTAGDGINPAHITFGSPPAPSGSPTFLVVNSTITDNGSAPVSVTLAGAYTSLNGNGTTGPINTYSGGTYILQGRISQPNEGAFGFGPIYIVSGGQANPGRATAVGVNITNDFYIEGSGTVENQGMGALRMFGNGGVNIGGVTTGTKLTGRITLTGNASVCANGDVTGNIGIGGKITGPGGFALGSTTFTAGNNNGAGGVFTVGDVAGQAIPNDYAGDTSINGSANAATVTGNNVGATLKIFTNADNNIMPHGSTGSFAGGKTGNLILNATVANNGNNACTFDLNGSTQTINGLISTVANPTHDIVTSSTSAGTLVLGDNNATATFVGILQDGAGLSLTKLGNGTETLTGANTYTGGTVVQAGKLTTTTASTGAGNYSVSNNATLGVTTATLGGTLAVNNLTFGSSSSLQLSSGSLGNPTAAIVHVNGALNMNGNVTVSLSGVGLTAGGPFTVATYNPANRSGSGVFSLVNSPRIVATLNDDTVNGIVTITITSADSAVKWEGGTGGNWDINDNTNTIWQTVPSANTTYYVETGSGNDIVLFDDTLTGTTNVNLTTNVSPQAITVSNSAASYLFAGPGKITGPTGLTKQGNGTLTIANSGNNDFSGSIAISGGTLIISNNSSIPNSVSGGGALTKNGNGTLILSGDNSGFSGPVSVNGGTLRVLSTASLATASSLTIGNGATVDIGFNTIALGQEPITVSGSGVNGNGAIVNSSGYSGGAVATSFQKVTMTGATSIGGPGRLDFRSTDPNLGSDATLSTGGQPFKLTKLSGSLLSLASVQIDNALGDIDVQAGTLSIQGNVPSLGNPANTLTVFGGATLQFATVGNALSKNLVLNDGSIVNNSAGANTYNSPVTLLGTALFNVGGVSVTFTNVLSGTGSLSKVTGALPMTLSASNTYSGDTTVSAGTLYLMGDGSVTHSRSMNIGTGATLDVTGRGDGTLSLASGQTLTGAGTISGTLTAPAGSTVAPGANANSIGTLTVNGLASVAGTTQMKLNATTHTSDTLSVGGTLTYGGSLVLTNISGTLVAGNSFLLFSAPSYSGSFSSILPATPGNNLTWNTNALSTSGVISVNGLTITNFVLTGSSVTIAGTGLTAGGQFAVLASTNVALPASQWTPIATNFFDSNGDFSFTTNYSSLGPQEFFMLREP